MKKFISLVLALVMALSLTTVAWGALAAMPIDGSSDDADGTVNGKIVLNDDVVLSSTYEVDGTLTIDLNGHTISGTDTTVDYNALIHVKNSGDLTIEDSVGTGKITYAASGSGIQGAAIWVEGALVLESGTVEITGDWSIGFAVDVRPNAWGTAYTEAASFTMNSGKIVASDSGVRVASNSSDSYPNLGVTFTMNGGTIDSAYDGIFVQNVSYDDTLTVEVVGGTVTSENTHAVRIYGNSDDKVDVEMSITGGSFTGEMTNLDQTGTGEVAISGGTFTDDVSAYAAPGFVLTQNAGGGYTANPDTAGSSTAALYDLKKANATGDEVKGDIGYEVIAASKDDSRGYTTGTLEYVKMDGKLFVKIAAADATISDFYVTKANEKTAQFYLKQIDSVADVSYDFVAEKFTNFGYKCDQMNASYVDYVTNEVGYYVWTHPVTGGKIYFADDAVTTGDAYYNKAVLRTGASNLLVGDKIVEAYGFVVAGTDNPADPLNQHVWAPVAYDKTTPVKAQCGICGAQATVYKNGKAPAGSDVIDVTFNQVPYDLVITYTGGYTGTVVTPSTDKVTSAETFDAGIAMYVGMSVMAAAGSAVVLKKRED